MNEPTFKGTTEQQTLAAEIFGLMAGQGTMFAEDAPIKQTLSNLVDFFATQHNTDRATLAQTIDAALCENAQIFARQEGDEEIMYVTSRLGMYQHRIEDTSHTFKERLYQPEQPLPTDDISVVVSTSRPALTTVEPVFISDYWQQQAGLIPMPLSDADMDEMDTVDGEPGSPPEVTVEVVPVADTSTDDTPTDTIPAGIVFDETPPADPLMFRRPFVEMPVTQDTTQEADAVEAVTPEIVSKEPSFIDAPVIEPPVVEETPLEVVPAEMDVIPSEPPTIPEEIVDEGSDDIAESIGDKEEVVPPEEGIEEVDEIAVAPAVEEPANHFVSNVSMVFTLPDGTAIDLSRPTAELMATHHEALAENLVSSIDHDPLQRIGRFGHVLFTEADKVNLGKNDLRRIREYIVEVREPLLDTTIIDDLYHHSSRQTAYESFRFSLNQRLSREKDFEFVGVEKAYLWSARGLPPIGTKRVKASEMGQLTSYLVDNYDDSLELQSAEAILESGTVNHLLSFFEWEYGILPLNAALATLLPQPFLPDQRSVVLRFESPQHYVTYLVEVRYPTGNRGGWIQGLEDFFHEHLVAGAFITLGLTEEPNVFTITYDEVPNVEDRLLILDEKKNKFAFANLEYYCSVDADQLLSQQRYGKLKNLKSLPMGDRRKADVVLSHIFEVLGEQVGTREEPLYWLAMDDLYVGYNTLRSASRPYLKSLLDADDAYAEDESTPGAYYYKPEPKMGEEVEDDDDDLLVQEQYDDDYY